MSKEGTAATNRKLDPRVIYCGDSLEQFRALPPACIDLIARGLKKTGRFCYDCAWHASQYVKVMLNQIFGEGYSNALSSIAVVS